MTQQQSELKRDYEARFWSKVDKTDGCWNWTGAKKGGGYGHVRIRTKDCCAHVVAYESAKGPVPEGLELDHLCRNPSCVNPDHLEPVTHKENVLRGTSPTSVNAFVSACPRGHPYSGKNLYLDPEGKRKCKACRKAQLEKWRMNHPERVAEFNRKYRKRRY